MRNNIFFSVIIPTYNRAAFIKGTLESVLVQSYDNFEIIIIDDGSTDNTEEVVKSVASPMITYYRIPNSERAAARNYGMDKAKGDYITFLDSDDVLYKDYLSNALQSLQKFYYPDFFHLAYESKSVKTGKSLHKYSVKTDDVYSLITGNHLSCLGIFIKREITEFYRFNEDRNLSGSEDWELWLRLAAHYGLKTDQRVSAALMVHDARSVVDVVDERKLPERKILAVKYALEDNAVQHVFGSYRNAMLAYCYTYVSLHLVLLGQNLEAIRFVGKAALSYPFSVINIRSLAIAKFILLNIVGVRKNL